jgi:parallel beta-helix repeat protein
MVFSEARKCFIIETICTHGDCRLSATSGNSLADGFAKARKRSPRVVVVTAVLATVLIIGAVAWLAIQSYNKKSDYTEHSPILINGNGGFTRANGVVGGSGTESEPYVVEGWDINASTAVGISIQGTDAHFIVRNCYVHGGSTSWSGIYLVNCFNGTLENNICSKNLNGVTLDSSSNNMLINNTCSSNSHDGIVFSSSSNELINNNCSSNNDDGIYLVYASNSTLRNNICSSNGHDGTSVDRSNNNSLSSNNCSSNNRDGMYLYLSRSNTLINNTCSGGINGINLFNSRNNTLVDNNCSNSHNGILLDFSDGNTIAENNCSSNNQYGIIIDAGSNYNVIGNNNCLNDLAGIYLDGSNYNVLSNNNCSNNQYGMYLYSSFDNTLSGNTCSLNLLSGIYLGILGPHLSSDNNEIFRNLMFNNAAYGVDISCGSNNRVWNNTFVGNNGATNAFGSSHTQARDNGTNNWWNSTEAYGNYWNDWTTPDVNHDGIVDPPYVISGSASAEDFYPLTAPP